MVIMNFEHSKSNVEIRPLLADSGHYPIVISFETLSVENSNSRQSENS